MRAAAAALKRGAAVAEAAAAGAAAAGSALAADGDEVARVLAARDHYEILSLPRGAGSAAARRAYRSTALRVHPDKCSAADAPAAWARVQRAGDVLSDDAARDEYDAALAGRSLAAAVAAVRRRPAARGRAAR